LATSNNIEPGMMSLKVNTIVPYHTTDQ